MKNSRIRYEQSTCTDLCIQDQLIKNCSCLNSDLSVTGEYLRDYSFCANASIAITAESDFLEMLQSSCPEEYADIKNRKEKNLLKKKEKNECVKKIYKKVLKTQNPKLLQDLNNTVNQLLCVLTSDLGSTACDCPQPCHSAEYEKTSISQAPWPHWSYSYAFYCKIIVPHLEKNPHHENFKKYQKNFGDCSEMDDYDDIFNTSSHNSEDKELIKNFLQLNVIFEHKKKTVYTTKPAVTWETLFSNIGGTLNLWIGITFITFVEVFELIFDVFMSYMLPEKKKKEVSHVDDTEGRSSDMPINESSQQNTNTVHQ